MSKIGPKCKLFIDRGDGKQIHIGTVGHGRARSNLDFIDRMFEEEIKRMSGVSDPEKLGEIRQQFERDLTESILMGSGDQWPKGNPAGILSATATFSDVKFNKEALDELIEEALKSRVVAHPHNAVKPGEMIVEDHEKAREEFPFYPITRRGKTIHFNPEDREKLEPAFREMSIPIEEVYKV